MTAETRSRPTPSASKALLPVIVASALLLVGSCAVGDLGRPDVSVAALVAVGTGVFECLVARLFSGRQLWTISVTETVLVAALMISPGAWLAVPGLVGILCAQLLRGRRDVYKVTFNVLMYAGTFAFAGVIASTVGHGVLGAVVGTGSFWVANFTLVAVGTHLLAGAHLFALISERVLVSALHATLNISVGVCAVLMLRTHSLNILALIAPLVGLLVAYDTVTRRTEDFRLMQAAAASALLTTGSLTPAEFSRVLLYTVAELIPGATVQLMLLRPAGMPGGQFLLTWDSEAATTRSIEVPAEDSPAWVEDALSTDASSILGRSGTASWCAARVGSPFAPFAVVHVASRNKHAVDRRCKRAIELLCSLSTRWLSGAVLERSVTDTIAADTTRQAAERLGPAVATVQSAAARLVQHASDVHNAGSEHLLAELRRVERSVAELVAVAADVETPEMGPHATVTTLHGAVPASASEPVRWVTLRDPGAEPAEATVATTIAIPA